MRQAPPMDEAPRDLENSSGKWLARLNCIHHQLEQIPYQNPSGFTIELPETQIGGECGLEVSVDKIPLRYRRSD